jgi:hypothetical protein
LRPKVAQPKFPISVSEPFVRQLLNNLNNSDLVFIGISDPFVQNIRYKLYRKENGDMRYLAML